MFMHLPNSTKITAKSDQPNQQNMFKIWSECEIPTGMSPGGTANFQWTLEIFGGITLQVIHFQQQPTMQAMDAG